MVTTAGAVRHTGRRYRRVARWAVQPLRGVESEARHLLLGSVFLVMLGSAFIAYDLP
jgi:hypothetical protein